MFPVGCCYRTSGDWMKTEGALARRFLRHAGIYRSDVSLLLVNLGRSAASRSVPSQAIGRAGRNTPCPSSTMSSGRLFLDGIAVGTNARNRAGTVTLDSVLPEVVKLLAGDIVFAAPSFRPRLRGNGT